MRVDWNVLSLPDMLILSGFKSRSCKSPRRPSNVPKRCQHHSSNQQKCLAQAVLIISANKEAIFECRHERTGIRHPTTLYQIFDPFRPLSALSEHVSASIRLRLFLKRRMQSEKYNRFKGMPRWQNRYIW